MALLMVPVPCVLVTVTLPLSLTESVKGEVLSNFFPFRSMVNVPLSTSISLVVVTSASSFTVLPLLFCAAVIASVRVAYCAVVSPMVTSATAFFTVLPPPF